MSDLISRQAAVDALSRYPFEKVVNCVSIIEELPSAQPELPKQFMSDDCISRSELYKKVCEAEKLARERVLDTPSDSPFPNKLNPAYTRYSAQLNERTQFKHMIADARSVQPEQQWILCSERLPEKGGQYLVTRGHKSCGNLWNRVYIVNYSDLMGLKKEKIWWSGDVGKSDFEKYDDVLAWMPLPKPHNAETR